MMVPMHGRHDRLLDLDEFADAIDSGVLTTNYATEALRRWQRLGSPFARGICAIEYVE